MPVAIGLPLLEVTAGIGLLFDIRGSLALIVGLLLLFMVVLVYGIGMGLDVDCGCFGPEYPEAEAFHGLRLSLFKDLVMIVGVIFIYGWRRYRAIRPARVMVIINQLLPAAITVPRGLSSSAIRTSTAIRAEYLHGKGQTFPLKR